VSFTTHRVRVQEQVTREIVIEINLFEGDKTDPEKLALEQAKRDGHSRDWKVIESIIEVADTKSGPAELIDYETETEGYDDGRKFCTVRGKSDLPDGIWRYAKVYEAAYSPGLFRISFHEHVNGRETWYGGRVSSDHDTRSYRSAKMLARRFVRRTFTP
jgi:hypothetical protein